MSDQTSLKPSKDLFYIAEQTGLKLAIKGRLVTVVILMALMALTRGPDRAVDYILAGILFSGLGIAHYLLIGSRFDRSWVKYVFISIDIALLSAAVALLPAAPETDIPQIMIFRFSIFPFYFILLGVAAFSFAPGLLLWTGVAGAAGWLSAFTWVRAGMDRALEWTDLPVDPTPTQFLEIVLNSGFAGTGSRLQEAAVFLVVAILLAIVMRRARQTVRKQLAAERETSLISGMFGRFVPAAVAESMIKDEGALDPVEREATVLFTDVAGFTSMTETKGPRAVVDTFNAFFDAASEVIGRHNGVVTQFLGDAILATFNVPIEDERHAQRALDAALDLMDLVKNETFAGERLDIRIGLSSGPVIAGNVGGGGRQSYTVYGDSVNLAARLESLNKEYGTSLLLSQSTADHVGQEALQRIGEIEVRGLSELVGVYTRAQ
ncbi:MAG: adenylate/guanylate cyclase domain-containing protein [Sneathiella sp.]|uniref:adenylate/guanylate cyclase domain-containing protein n=1 Tax=Sneathiella sp. TaxID=1964365 RepID=UPI00300291D9